MTSIVEIPKTEEKPETTNLMKAIVRTKYGKADQVLQLKEVEKPVPNELRGVLVEIHAASVNPADRYDSSPPFMIRIIGSLSRGGLGIRGPKDLTVGSDAAGRVVAVTDKITQFKPGDEVFGACKGAYAEYAVAREDRLVLKPSNISFEEAAAIPIAATTALQGLRDKGLIRPGQKVLVNGAGGGVGTYAVQIAKSFGAEVTAVTNTNNLDMVRSIGADHVIDYTQEDFTRNGIQYDLICDVASHNSIGDYRRVLKPAGICVLIGFKNKIVPRLLYFLTIGKVVPKGGRKFRFFVANINQKDLNVLKELLESGKVVSIIDGRYPLGETAEAIHRIEQANARGKIAITVARN